MDALSLTGERRGVFSILFLIRDKLNDNGTTDTSLENIYDVFLETANLLQVFNPTSEHPASALAIASYITQELLNYRRTDVLIELSEINQFFEYLSNYRLLTNQNFTALQTNTLQFKQNAVDTDLGSKITTIESQIQQLNVDLSRFAIAQTGENVVETEQSWSSYVASHVRDKLVDAIWQGGKNHQNYVSGTEWATTWMTPSHYIVHTNESSRVEGFRPDSKWTMATMADMQGRYVYKRKRIDPSVFNFPGISPVPSGDNKTIDLGLVMYSDLEFRGNDASILLGKAGTPYAATFKLKAVTDYFREGAASFGGEPTAVKHTNTLLTVDTSAANFSVPVFVNGVQLGGTQTVHRTSHATHLHQDQHVHITRKHRHNHTHIHAGDHITHYTAPSRTVKNVFQQHTIHHFEEVTQRLTKVYRTQITLPSIIQNDFTQIINKATWHEIRNKPDFDQLYTSFTYVTDSIAAATQDKIDDTQLQAQLQSYVTATALSSTLESYVTDTELNQALALQNLNDFYTKQETDILLGQRVGQTHFDSAIGSINASLGNKLDSSALNDHYTKAETYSQAEVNGIVGDKITLAGAQLLLNPYATTNALNAATQDVVRTDTELYLKADTLYSNSLKVKWRQFNVDQEVTLVKLSSFQDLLTRVTTLEQQIGTLFDQQAAADNARTTIESTQNSIWSFTQNALQRITTLEG